MRRCAVFTTITDTDMTTYEFQRYLDSLVKATSTEHILTKYVFILARGYDQIAAELTDVLHVKNRTLYSKSQQETQNQFFEFRKHADNFPMGQIFHEVIGLQKALAEMKEAFNEEKEKFIDTLSQHLDDFYGALEDCVKGGADGAFINLMMEASHLYPMMTTARQVFGLVKRGLQRTNQVEEQEDEHRLALVFDRPQSYEGVLTKLKALRRAYEEVATLMGVPLLEYPLRLVQIETGSLWLSVQGHHHVIPVLTALIERFTAFLHHRFSIKGTATRVSERVIATQSLINLADELELAGIEHILDDEETLKQSALVLRNEITKLLAGEPSVRINGTLHAIGDDVKEYYIEHTLGLLPQHTQPVPLRKHG